MGEVIALGSVNVDVQMRAERWPGPGETLLGEEFALMGGGKAANVAYLARRLGVPARLVARVGSDVLGEQALAQPARSGVSLDYTKRVEGAATGVALIVVRPDGEKAIVLAANANQAWTPEDAEEAARAVTEAPPGSVLVADLEVPVPVVRRAVTAAREAGHLVVLDPSPAERFGTDLAPLTGYLTPNRTEAQRLTGIAVRSVADAFRAGETLCQRGVEVALMKLGAEGCAVVTREGRDHVHVAPVDVVDTTGAGDAFASALAVGLVERRPVLEAARFAAAAAALAVTRYGSQSSYPTRAELERFTGLGRVS